MSIAIITFWSVVFLWKSLIPMNIRFDGPPLGKPIDEEKPKYVENYSLKNFINPTPLFD